MVPSFSSSNRAFKFYSLGQMQVGQPQLGTQNKLLLEWGLGSGLATCCIKSWLDTSCGIELEKSNAVMKSC